MKKILSYLTYAFLWSIAWIPTSLLYGLSDFIYLVMYRLVGYRKKVVEENLRNAFPDETETRRKEIMQKFYRHLCDLIVEEIRMIHIPTKELIRRVEIREGDLERFDEMQKKGIHTVIGAGHYGNWEWANAFVAQTSYNVMAIYKPLKDKVVERLLSKARLRWLDAVVPLHHVYRAILRYHQENIPTMYYFITDQTPLPFETEYVTRFLNQETAVYLGIEKVAKKFGDPAFFLVMKKKKRGYYRLEIHDCCPDPGAEKPYAITEKHVRMLEMFIREAPEYWLWSHRRWKYSRQVREKKNVVFGRMNNE